MLDSRAPIGAKRRWKHRADRQARVAGAPEAHGKDRGKAQELAQVEAAVEEVAGPGRLALGLDGREAAV
jgi:hypothetical protein